MHMDRITAKERLQVPLAWKLRQYGACFRVLLKGNASMSIISKAVKELIAEHVSHRKSFCALSNKECRELISTIIRTMPEHYKAGILSDTDYHITLPNLIANFIEHESFNATVKLIEGIKSVFIGKHVAFAMDIQEIFEDEWREQWPEENEHFRQDCIERAKNARWGQ